MFAGVTEVGSKLSIAAKWLSVVDIQMTFKMTLTAA